MNKPRRELLKFSGPTAYALDNLRNKLLYCQHYGRFNDPFEFWTDFREGIPDLGKERDRFIAAITAWGFSDDSLPTAVDNSEDYFDSIQEMQPPFEEMADSIRISCFGSERANLLMWSHYADGLRGFCLVFDEQLIVKAKPEGYITDVAYLEKPPLVDSFVYAVAQDQEDYHMTAIQETRTRVRYLAKTGERGLIDDYREAAGVALKQMQEMWQHAFAAKPIEWRYEKERRLLVHSGREDSEPILRKYPRRAVREIIIGERMPADYLRQLTAIVREKYGDIPVRTARRSSDFYTLLID